MNAILFDIDGTLLKARGVGRPAFARAFREAYGADYPRIEALSFIGATDTAVLRSMVAECGLRPDPAREARFFARLAIHLDAALAATPPEVLPGVPELLAALAARGDALGLVTGNIRATALSKVRRAGLARHFTFGGYGDDSPDRAAIARAALARLPAGAEPLALVGDTPRDIEAARAVGLRAVAVASGWLTRDQLAPARPDVLLGTLADLPAALSALSPGPSGGPAHP